MQNFLFYFFLFILNGMEIVFLLYKETRCGCVIRMEIMQNGSWECYPMIYCGGNAWRLEIIVNQNVEYRYSLIHCITGDVIDQEEGCRSISMSLVDVAFTRFDKWCDITKPFHPFYSTSYFQNLLQPQSKLDGMEVESNVSLEKLRKYEVYLEFIVKYGLLRESEKLAIVGDCEELGNWNIEKAVILSALDDNQSFHCYITKSNEIAFSIEYKFIIIKSNNSFIWEGGENRILDTELVHSSQKKIQIIDNHFRVCSHFHYN